MVSSVPRRRRSRPPATPCAAPYRAGAGHCSHTWLRRSGILTAAGEHFIITRLDHVSSRLDVAAVKAFLGDAWRRFETTGITAVIRVKAVQRLAKPA